MGATRNAALAAFERDAETLVVYQTDVMAQIEHQLRAARQTIRLVQKLRAAPDRVGPELTETERHHTLDSLSAYWAELDAQLVTQHECCLDIQNTIAKMRDRLRALRTRAGASRSPTWRGRPRRRWSRSHD
jgi:hypothetical protein